MTQPDISVFGAGSYGTALAIQLARNGARVALWGRDAAALERIGAEGVNARYLPDCPFPEGLEVCADLATAAAAGRWLLAVPSHALQAMLAADAAQRPSGDDVLKLPWLASETSDAPLATYKATLKEWNDTR